MCALLLQVTICQKCGDSGWDVALIYCDNCQVYAEHRYELFILCLCGGMHWQCQCVCLSLSGSVPLYGMLTQVDRGADAVYSNALWT
jgi:hypothetical protein